MGGPVTYEPEEGFSTVRLDDGKANVMSVEMMDALNEALDRAEADEKILLLTGRDGMFSGGFDLAAFEEGPGALIEMLKTGADTLERLLSFPRPVVVACTGHALAMGLFLVLAGDERIGAAGNFTLQANEVEIGLTLPRFATEICRQRMTPADLSRATILAQPYSPEQARGAGFLDRVVPPDEVMDRARKTAASLQRLDMEAHAATKLRVRGPALERFRTALAEDVEEWESHFT